MDLSYNPECRVMNYPMGLPKTKKYCEQHPNSGSEEAPEKFYSSNSRGEIIKYKRISLLILNKKIISILEQ